MITIIERHEPETRRARFRVTCKICKSIFECDESDTVRGLIGHGVIAERVKCPVCWSTCCNWQGYDKFEVIEG